MADIGELSFFIRLDSKSLNRRLAEVRHAFQRRDVDMTSATVSIEESSKPYELTLRFKHPDLEVLVGVPVWVMREGK